ncbi:MAG: ATP-binding protein [Candidatus Zixiibacteriota bacterium]
MKQIVIISGKGGTGKTTFTSALARIMPSKALVDADVDASNLEIVTDAKEINRDDFWDGQFAKIDQDKCVLCGKCYESCRFAAIISDNGNYLVDEHSCEGCKVCQLVCPVEAISMHDMNSGYLKHSETPFGGLFHGELSAGRDNSGKMVTKVREQGSDFAEENDLDFVLIDGAPGIGCQVIASITGVDYAIAVAEPSLSALHDLKRVVQVAEHFMVPVGIVINKADLNPELAAEIKKWAGNREILGEIPFDKRIVKAMSRRKSPIEIGDDELSLIYEDIYSNFIKDCQKKT